MYPRLSALAADILLVMDFDGSALEHLARDECIRLMASVPVGRIVYIRISPAIVHGRRLGAQHIKAGSDARHV